MLYKIFKIVWKWLLQAYRSALVKMVLVALLMGYAIAAVYFYNIYGLRSFGWHSHVMLPVYFYLAGLALIYLFNWCGALKSRRYLAEMWSYIIWLYLVVEVLILTTGIAKVHAEDSHGYYMAPYETRGKSFYHSLRVGSRYQLSSGEFNFSRITNSLGFSDYEWEKKKPAGVIRLLCLGDSFTEGDGATYDSSYVAHLRRQVATEFENIEVMNAGIRGSDPFFNFVNLRDKLQDYEPDIVIQTLSSSDLFYDYRQRGGLERFGSEGNQLIFKKLWWEPIYAASYFARVFVKAMGYNSDLTKQSWGADERQQAILAHQELFLKEYVSLADNKNMTIFLVYLPMREEIASEKYLFNWSKSLSGLQKSPWKTLDLLPCYRSSLEAKNFSITDLYWDKDAHHNGLGYNVMADCMLSAIRPALDSLTNPNDKFNGETLN